MNIYEIRKMLEGYERAIFTLNEIARVIGKNKKISAVYANRMLKKGLLFKIEKNKYSLTDDIFIISSQLISPSYLGLTTSLYLYNEIPQIIDKIYVISPKTKRKMNIFNNNIIFIKINPKLMFGYKKIKRGDSFILISDLEKTLIDCLLYERYCRINYIFKALKNIDIKKLKYYLSLSKKEALNRKIGFMLDVLKIKHNLKRKTKTVYKLNPRIKSKGKFNKKWNLYINEGLT